MADKHTLVISTVDENNNINQKSITNINPLATKLEMRTFAEKLAALTDDTYVSSATVTRKELTSGTRPIVPCTVLFTKYWGIEQAVRQTGVSPIDISDILNHPGVLTGSTFTEKTTTYKNLSYNFYEAKLRISKNNTSLVGDGETFTKNGTEYLRFYSRAYFVGENLQLWGCDETSVSAEFFDGIGGLSSAFQHFMNPFGFVHAHMKPLWRPSDSYSAQFVVKDIHNEYAPIHFAIKFVDE